MRPLPVLAIIQEAWRFTFQQLGAIIGLIWVPTLAMTVAGFFVMQRYLDGMQVLMATQDSQAMSGPGLMLLLYFVVSLLLYAMMIVPVAQLALGTRQGGAKIQFAFGAGEWRLFQALFGLALFLLVPTIVAGLAVGMMMPGGEAANPAAGARLLLALLVYCAVMAFLLLRFAFLLPALAASSDEKGLLARSWTLSAGNFWRILAVVLGTVVVFTVVATLVESALLRMLVAPAPAGDTAASLRAMQHNLPLSTGLSFLLMPFLVGLGVSASAFSWRALTRTDISA